MSETSEAHERQYCELSASLSKKFAFASLVNGEQKKQRITEIKSLLDSAESLIRKMDIAAGTSQLNVKAALLPHLKEYKSDLNYLKSEAKKLMSSNDNQATRDELLESGIADTLNEPTDLDQRSRLLMSTERLNKTSEIIEQGRRIMLETEDLGVALLQDLHRQRQSLLHANEILDGVIDNVSRARRNLNSISSRMHRNKWIIVSVAAVLIFAVLVILYFKLTH